MYEEIKCKRNCTPRKTLNQAYLSKTRPCTRRCAWYKHDKIKVSERYADVHKYNHSSKPTWYVWREQDKLRPVRGQKNFYLSRDKPCFDNMHGTDIWNKEKGCAWYLNGRKISEDPDYYYHPHELGNYVWRRA